MTTQWQLETRLLVCFFLALGVASLLNWAIYQLAWNRRAVSPWSLPPAGLPRRTLLDRIPVIGWLRLRREAHFWGKRFWVRPLLLELGFAFAATVLYWFDVEGETVLIFPAEAATNPWPKPAAGEVNLSIFASHAVLLCLLTVITFIDIDEKTIPDTITLPGTLLGLLLVTLNPWTLPTIAVPGGEVLSGHLTQNSDHKLHLDFIHLMAPRVYEASGAALGQLGLAIGCLWFWVVALLPRVWHQRAGLRKAWNYFWVALFCGRRKRETAVLLGVGGALTLGVIYTWSQGGVSWVGLLSGLCGMACGTVLIWSIRLVGRATLKKEAMGFGDVTLLAMIGSFAGWQATLVIFFLAPLAGLCIGLLQYALRKEDVVPYGPFLCLATAVVLLSWAPIWDYLGPIFASAGSLLPLALLVCLAGMAAMLSGWRGIKMRYFHGGNRA